MGNAATAGGQHAATAGEVPRVDGDVVMPELSWARLKTDLHLGLRRGAWYRVIREAYGQVILDVEHQPVTVLREYLEFVSVRPDPWPGPPSPCRACDPVARPRRFPDRTLHRPAQAHHVSRRPSVAGAGGGRGNAPRGAAGGEPIDGVARRRASPAGDRGGGDRPHPPRPGRARRAPPPPSPRRDHLPAWSRGGRGRERPEDPGRRRGAEWRAAGPRAVRAVARLGARAAAPAHVRAAGAGGRRDGAVRGGAGGARGATVGRPGAGRPRDGAR